jgi:phage terminase large subunit
MSLIASLRALPPKQALALALAEKARRAKKKATQEQLSQDLVNASASSSLPTLLDVPSLILNRDHPLSALYYEKARYKVYWGGRGSAKSWGFAEALVRIMAERPVLVLCAREHQNSIKDSVHSLLKATIARLGLENWFEVTEREIRSKTGAKAIFWGLWGKDDDLRSLHGVDIVWVEEAHAVSDLSWRALLPTIRSADSEIWVSMNFVSEDNATFQRFVGELHEGRLANPPRSRSIVHKVNYDSNPYFGGVLLEEMNDDRKLDQQLYEHIWLGLPLRISKEIIFSGCWEEKVFDDDYWQKLPDFTWRCDGLRFGLDFGFAQDPLALLRMFLVHGSSETGKEWTDLYISHEVYGTGIELDEMPEAFDSIPDVRNWPIKADASNPAQISYLTRQGFRCSAAEKWERCVEDGIQHIRKFRRIYVHPRCVKTLAELRLYKYKTDPKQLDPKTKQPLVLPIVVDKHNHSMDAMRYGLDGEITRGGVLGMWARLGQKG